MPEQPLVFGILIVILVCAVLIIIQFFMPIVVKIEFNQECRNTLLKMENKGGLTAQDRDNLKSKLEARGLTNVTVTGTGSAKKYEEIVLSVKADYTYNRLSGLFTRQTDAKVMAYTKYSVCRKVIN